MAYQNYRYSTPRFMDDSVFRSGSSTSSSHISTRDSLNSRSSYDTSPRLQYPNLAVDEHGMAVDRRSQYEGSLCHPYADSSRSYREDDRRRLDLDYAPYSSGLSTRYPQIQPRLCRDGRYPPSFSQPLQYEDFYAMPDSQLQQIMLAYKLSCALASRNGDRDRLRGRAGDGRSMRRDDLDALRRFCEEERVAGDLRRRGGL